MTFEDVFQEWIEMHGPDLSAKYSKGMVRLWDREIATRAISQVRLDWFSGDPAVLVRFQDQLGREVKPSKCREIMKLLRAVLFFGHARHPNAMTVDISGLVKLPKVKRKRLPYAPDAIGVERIIEAVLNVLPALRQLADALGDFRGNLGDLAKEPLALNRHRALGDVALNALGEVQQAQAGLRSNPNPSPCARPAACWW